MVNAQGDEQPTTKTAEAVTEATWEAAVPVFVEGGSAPHAVEGRLIRGLCSRTWRKHREHENYDKNERKNSCGVTCREADNYLLLQ